MFGLIILLTIIILTITTPAIIYITLVNIYDLQMDYFQNAIRNIQTALIAEYRYNYKPTKKGDDEQ